ncbi:MAG: membrane protein insertion efficiency factor YidD [Candidatus Omnitrophica bacterium]|nr:membrane protein insertion efficiency factor YidD [Candidatus Omnitrophota bacterium]
MRVGRLSRLAIFLIRSYKVCLSPYLGVGCRFAPSCSEYMIGAITKKGFARGFIAGLARLLRCHPFHPGGYDPVGDK